MKRGLLVLLIALSVFGVTNVKAMNESDLRTKMTASYTINGATFKLDDYVVVQIDRYLDTYEVSPEDCDYIAGKVDEAVAIVEAGNATSMDQVSASERKQLSGLVTDVNNNTSVKATVKSGTVIIYDPNTGAEFTRLTPPAKQTGTTDYILLSSGIIALAGIGALVIKKGKNENV